MHEPANKHKFGYYTYINIILYYIIQRFVSALMHRLIPAESGEVRPMAGSRHNDGGQKTWPNRGNHDSSRFQTPSHVVRLAAEEQISERRRTKEGSGQRAMPRGDLDFG